MLPLSPLLLLLLPGGRADMLPDVTMIPSRRAKAGGASNSSEVDGVRLDSAASFGLGGRPAAGAAAGVAAEVAAAGGAKASAILWTA